MSGRLQAPPIQNGLLTAETPVTNRKSSVHATTTNGRHFREHAYFTAPMYTDTPETRPVSEQA